MQPVTAQQLAERIEALRDPAVRGLDGGDLEDWILRAGFATKVGDCLAATPLGVEVGSLLEEIGLDSARNH